MPDFASGNGMMLTLDMTIEAGNLLAEELEKLPMDPSVVENRLGAKFMEWLRDD